MYKGNINKYLDELNLYIERQFGLSIEIKEGGYPREQRIVVYLTDDRMFATWSDNEWVRLDDVDNEHFEDYMLKLVKDSLKRHGICTKEI